MDRDKNENFDRSRVCFFAIPGVEEGLKSMIERLRSEAKSPLSLSSWCWGMEEGEKREGLRVGCEWKRELRVHRFLLVVEERI